MTAADEVDNRLVQLARNPLLALISRVAVLLMTALVGIVTTLSIWTLSTLVDLKSQVSSLQVEVHGYDKRMTTIERFTFGAPHHRNGVPVLEDGSFYVR